MKPGKQNLEIRLTDLISDEMERRGMTQTEMALRLRLSGLRMSTTMCNKILNNRCRLTIGTFGKICTVLDIPPHELIRQAL